LFFFDVCVPPRDLHSFPTRRSSDLSGVASTAHLGGLVAGYLYLKGGRIHLLSEIKYRYLKWRINRTRRKFDIYSGGRSADDVNRSEEHTSELQSRFDLVCRHLLEKK